MAPVGSCGASAATAAASHGELVHEQPQARRGDIAERACASRAVVRCSAIKRLSGTAEFLTTFELLGTLVVVLVFVAGLPAEARIQSFSPTAVAAAEVELLDDELSAARVRLASSTGVGAARESERTSRSPFPRWSSAHGWSPRTFPFVICRTKLKESSGSAILEPPPCTAMSFILFKKLRCELKLTLEPVHFGNSVYSGSFLRGAACYEKGQVQSPPGPSEAELLRTCPSESHGGSELVRRQG